MSKTYTEFFAAIRARESSGNYAAINSFGYLGAYQFGEAALVDLGFVVRDSNPFDNKITRGFTGKFGVDTRSEFLASRSAQDAAATEWFELLWNRIRFNDLEFYDQQTLNGIKLTKTGMIAASHLLGTGAVIDFIRSGGTDVGQDGLGTKITEYLKLFAGHDTPVAFLNNLSRANTIEGGAQNDRLNGLGGDDTLNGGGGSDVLTGGAGKDRLSGGTGADTFQFRAISDGGDVIRDFSSADQLVFNGSNFGLGEATGALDADVFWRSTSNRAHDADDRFIFRSTDDTLWFDANGSRVGGLSLVADFTTNVAIGADDIWLV